MALYWSDPARLRKVKVKQGAYTLVVRGADGRLHYERFDTSTAYLTRLMALKQSSVESVSIEEIASLLDS